MIWDRCGLVESSSSSSCPRSLPWWHLSPIRGWGLLRWSHPVTSTTLWGRYDAVLIGKGRMGTPQQWRAQSCLTLCA